MPITKESMFGTNEDESKNENYCSYCFSKGSFTVEMTLNEFIEKQVEIATERMGISEDEARKMAESVLGNLKRWKK